MERTDGGLIENPVVVVVGSRFVSNSANASRRSQHHQFLSRATDIGSPVMRRLDFSIPGAVSCDRTAIVPSWIHFPAASRPPRFIRQPASRHHHRLPHHRPKPRRPAIRRRLLQRRPAIRRRLLQPTVRLSATLPYHHANLRGHNPPPYRSSTKSTKGGSRQCPAFTSLISFHSCMIASCWDSSEGPGHRTRALLETKPEPPVPRHFQLLKVLASREVDTHPRGSGWRGHRNPR
jgi:hypothetical protein